MYGQDYEKLLDDLRGDWVMLSPRRQKICKNGGENMINYETVSIELSLDYIKAIKCMCQKMNISRQIFLKKMC